MANIMKFKKGDTLLGQGNEDTAAYLIASGWLEVHRIQEDGAIYITTLQAGEIVGELGLAGLSHQRTATVVALTDGEVEVIDRGALVRLVNMPGGALTPLLAALFSRLQTAFIENDSDELDDTFIPYAELEGISSNAKQALCNQTKVIGSLPWVFGAYHPPKTVTELFEDPKRIDVKLTGCSLLVHENHIMIEAAKEGGLQLHIHDYRTCCELDGEAVDYNKAEGTVFLSVGTHILEFGEQRNMFKFSLRVLM